MSNNESPARNIIGNGTIIKGEIESNGDIRIDGKVEGIIRSNGKVVLGQNGCIKKKSMSCLSSTGFSPLLIL